MTDNHAAMVEFIRAYDELRECQWRVLECTTPHQRFAAADAAKVAERKADVLRRRVALPTEAAK